MQCVHFWAWLWPWCWDAESNFNRRWRSVLVCWLCLQCKAMICYRNTAYFPKVVPVGTNNFSPCKNVGTIPGWVLIRHGHHFYDTVRSVDNVEVGSHSRITCGKEEGHSECCKRPSHIQMYMESSRIDRYSKGQQWTWFKGAIKTVFVFISNTRMNCLWSSSASVRFSI